VATEEVGYAKRQQVRAVVLKVGSARQFSGDREAPSKKINLALLKKKILCKIKFSGNIFFQTKLSKHNLDYGSLILLRKQTVTFTKVGII